MHPSAFMTAYNVFSFVDHLAQNSMNIQNNLNYF